MRQSTTKMSISWSRNSYKPLLLAVLLFALVVSWFPGKEPQAAVAASGSEAAPAFDSTCERLGWFPESFGLKDHHIFWHDGYYYLVSIYLPGETQFAYGRSLDLCQWEELAPVLPARTPGEWDEYVVWAPYVYEEEGVYSMFYTGVTDDYTQSILLATSQNPADPDSWQRQGVVFQPSHTGMVWQPGAWADCRDPMVMRIGELYYLYYTGRDTTGFIIGLATATALSGPWQDWGAVMTIAQSVPESPTVAIHDGVYYLFYHNAYEGEEYRIGATPAGPWTAPHPFVPGWAHEIWLGQDGLEYTSYLTDLTVTILPLGWDNFYAPPHPFIGESVHHILLPLILRSP